MGEKEKGRKKMSFAMDSILRNCPVCGGRLPGSRLYVYSECLICKSYTYISDRSDEEENMAYFNEHFFDLKKYSRSIIKAIIFSHFLRRDKLYRSAEYPKLGHIRSETQRVFCKGNRILEIGFGSGRRLVKWLDSGFDAYGQDLSESAVKRFKDAYPHYRDRVSSGAGVEGAFDVVACEAVMEHVENPGNFIDAMTKNLRKGGILLVGSVPIINGNKADLTPENDVSFWRPCHRIIFSEDGLLRLFKEKGLLLVAGAAADVFIYRVLSAHMMKNYPAIMTVRDPKSSCPELPGFYEFYRICNDAINIRSLALCGTYIFRKE